MNKNSIIGFVLIFVILIGYSYFTQPSAEELEKIRKERVIQDSIANADEAKRTEAATLKSKGFNSNSDENTTIAAIDSISADSTALDSLAKPTINTPFDVAKKGNIKSIIVNTEKYKVNLSTLGGIIESATVNNYVTYDTTPLMLFDRNTSQFNLILGDNSLGTKDLYFEPIYKKGIQPGVDSINISKDETVIIGMRLYPNDNNGLVNKDHYLEFEYIFKGDNYMIDFNLNMNKVNDVVAPGYNEILLNWNTILTRKEKDAKQERNQTTIYYKYKDDKVDYLGEMKDEDKEEISTKLHWISYKQQFFASTLIADNAFNRANINQVVDKDLMTNDPNYLETMESEIGIPLGGSDIETFKMKWYFGPNKFNILKKYDLELEQQIPLGWGFFLLAWINKFAVIPVFDFLSSFGWNYGIIILVLTLLLKLVLFPIAYKTYASSAKMRVLKPEIDEIGAKYPKKEDAMKKQQAVMGLYKKAGVNPMAGCVPMLLQLPILIALFRFFPASIELRQQSFLWATDLSSYDAIVSWTTQIPLLSEYYGNHISLFTVLMTISTIIYTKMNSDMMGSSNQLPGMKTIMYLMPLMFLGFFNNYAAGLSYYYFLANMITFGQMYAIRGLINEDKIRAKINENKKKPVKKSALQLKLEEAAKKKGIKY